MNMDWNNSMSSSGGGRTFVPRPENSFNFLFNYNLDPYQGMEMKHPGSGVGSPADMMVAPPHMLNHATLMDKLGGGGSSGYGGETAGGCMTTMSMSSPHGAQLAADKKKRLSNDQLDSLENSFQEDIKLDPDRKMKLARELGLQPRQVAVWFQNRRARWKAKQLEQLYDSLKLEFDAISNEKQKLQEEVMTLRAMLMEQAAAGRNNNVNNNNHNKRREVSTAAGYTDFSGEETVESTSGLHTISGGGGSGCSTRLASPAPAHQGMMMTAAQHGHNVVTDPYCHYLLTAADGVECNTVSPSQPAAVPSPYWAVVASTLPAPYHC